MKRKILKDKVEHIDIKKFNAVSILEQYDKTAFQAKNLARAARIYNNMLEDSKCSVILCLKSSRSGKCQAWAASTQTDISGSMLFT